MLDNEKRNTFKKSSTKYIIILPTRVCTKLSFEFEKHLKCPKILFTIFLSLLYTLVSLLGTTYDVEYLLSNKNDV